MNCKPVSILRNDKGSALIITVLILVAATVIGLLASRTANIEQRIASYDKFHKMTWYATDSVVLGLMPELIEQNIAKRFHGSCREI
jgi:Tfp pilus assembly protein PilX